MRTRERKETTEDQWIPRDKRLPDEERYEYCKTHYAYLYPCLVTRLSSPEISQSGTRIYVAKHYFDGEDFLNNGEEICTDLILAWKPLPQPYIPRTMKRSVECGDITVW